MTEKAPEKDRSRWRGQPLAIRLIALSKLFIEHDDVKAIVDFLELELQFRSAEGKATGLLVIAPPGGGKTWLVKYLEQLYPSEDTATLTIQRIVKFKVPKSPTPKAMGEALLKALKDPQPKAGNATDKFDRIGILLKKVGAQIVALDDFQDVPAKRGARGVEQIAYWIRDLCDLDFPGVIVALGTDDAAVVRDAHDQVLRRMQAKLELPLFCVDTPAQTKRFMKLLQLIDAELPLVESSGLSQAKYVARLYMATKGNLDYLMKLLARALARAVARGSERIEMVDLQQGFIDQHQVSAVGGNPFADIYDGEPLTRQGQIFHRLDPEDEAQHASRSRRQPRSPRGANDKTPRRGA